MKLTVHKINEANIQHVLAERLVMCGFMIRLEGVPQSGKNVIAGVRFDIIILDRKERIAGVVECKNMMNRRACIKMETEWLNSPQGERYTELSQKYEFELFICGGVDRIMDCVKSVKKAFPWWKRIWKGV